MKNRTYKDLSEFKKRREKIYKQCPNSAFVLFAGSENGWDRFRPSNDFIYATGFEEPDSICVLLPGQKDQFVMFVRPRDPAKEIWDGYRYGLDGVKSVFGADASYTTEEFATEFPKMLMGVERVYYQMEGNERDWKVVRPIHEFINKLGRTGRGVLPIHDPKDVLGEMRVKKSAQDIAWHREACDISAETHRVLMQSVQPGMNEKDIQAIVFKEFFARGAHREGYFSIIAAGANATILHYRDNNSVSKDGDLLLVDAAAEKNYFTSDITRTYPMNGKYTAAQRDVYSRVLKVQKNLIAMVKPGISYEEIQNGARRQLTQELIEMGFLKGSLDQNLESLAYTKYYPHNIGHFLGMDVHDMGLYRVNGKSRLLEEGIVFTIEPGLYIPEDDQTVPKEYRGIGVRIEDDILVTKNGHEVLTARAPKEIDEIEALMAESRRLT
jgi:Xaa-Pro aminopeptidase